MPAIKTTFDWVTLAASKDPDDQLFNSYGADAHHVAATDRYRLHVVPRRLAEEIPAGVCDLKTFAPIEGSYPAWQNIVPGLYGHERYPIYFDITYPGSDVLEHLRAMCAAAIAANRSARIDPYAEFGYKIVLHFADQFRPFKASYLLDALRLADHNAYAKVELGFDTKPESGLHVSHGCGAEALVMPASRTVDPLDKRSLVVDLL